MPVNDVSRALHVRSDRKVSNQRSFLFLASLVGALCCTSFVLMALAPAPLTPDASTSLYAIQAASQLDEIFATQRPVRRGAWRYIYVHQSRKTSTDAQAGQSDHFTIGNGQGIRDGQLHLSQRWDQQLPAMAPPDGTLSEPDVTISICMVGNLDESPPTYDQMRRLIELVRLLQARFAIPAENVTWLEQPGFAAAAGVHFPADRFRAELLP
jgi:hypothetical protein